MNNDRDPRHLHAATARHDSSARSLVRPRRCRQCGADVSRIEKRCPICGQPLSIGAAKR